MSTIKVHLLNVHFIFTHIEIVLEDTSTQPHAFYTMNRWAKPSENWSDRNIWYDYGFPGLTSTFSFELEADREDIIKRWQQYWYDTEGERSLLTHNCAVATQWFLREIVGIPNPDMSNLSLNHFIFGLFWPSFLKFPITLPGRIMSNAKFHLSTKAHQKQAEEYSQLHLYAQMALAALLFSSASIAIGLSLAYLSTVTATVAVIAGLCTSWGSTQLFFDAYNKQSLKQSMDDRPNNCDITSSSARCPSV